MEDKAKYAAEKDADEQNAKDKKKAAAKDEVEKKSDTIGDGRSTNDTQADDITSLKLQVEALIRTMQQLIDRPASVATTGTPIGPEPKGSFDQNSPISTVVTQFSEALQAASLKTGDERLAAFQDILNATGNQMKEVHLSLSANESPIKKSEGIPDLSEVVNRALDEKLAPFAASMAALAESVKGLKVGQAPVVQQSTTRKVEIPQMKSIVTPTNVPVTPPTKMSIFDIATRTTFGH